MNWILIITISILVIGAATGGLYYYYSQSSCCPPGFNRKYLDAVNVDAECDKETQTCKRCIGINAPVPENWKSEIVGYQGNIQVTDANC